MTQIPNDLLMKEMSKIAIEQATEMFAVMALKFSEAIPAHVSGRDALKAFAETIRETNEQSYPKRGSAS